MNAKNNHCMKTSRIILLAVAMMFSAPLLTAQTYERVTENNPWLSGRNAAGIRQDTVSVSNAELYGKMESGDFKATYDASSSWTAGVSAGTLKHLDKFSMKGDFSFAQMQGKDMCGSMFIKPGFYPVDVLEFTPGLKTLQTYSFDGSISVDMAPHWRLGASMDFESSNFAKRKDLRHSNYRLDMTVSPSLMYHNGTFAAGVSYVFSKNSESVKADQIGTSVSTYAAFLDKGLYYGVMENWDGSGTHLSESGVSRFPVQEYLNGVALQMQAGGFFAEAQWLADKGRIGEKQSVWYRFDGWESTALVRYSAGRHTVQANADWKHQLNYETVLEKVTSGGVTTGVEYGSNLVYTRNCATFGGAYSYDSELWRLRAELGLLYRDGLSSLMYPFAQAQKILVPSGNVSLTRMFGKTELKAAAGISKGSSEESSRTLPATVDVLGTPVRLDDYNSLYLEYLTTARYSASIGLRQYFGRGLYVSAEAGALYAPQAVLISGKSRLAGAIRFGYNF